MNPILDLESVGVIGTFAYAWRDDFATDDAAPIADPLPMSPGPGEWDVIDTGNNLDVSGGWLVPSGLNSQLDPQLTRSGVITRAAGFTNMVRFTYKSTRYHWGFISVSPMTAYSQAHASFGDLGIADVARDSNISPSLSAAFTVDQTYTMAIVLRDTGFYLLHKHTDWKLLWVCKNLTTASLYAHISSRAVTFDSPFDFNYGGQLDAPWDDEDCLITDEAASIGLNDTWTHEADFWKEFTITTLPTTSINLQFRIQDANNNWWLEITSAGNIVLYEEVSGSPVARGSAAGALLGGERLVIVTDDETITVYYDSSEAFSYSSAVNFKTKTDGKCVLNDGGDIDNLIVYQLDISGAALSALTKME